MASASPNPASGLYPPARPLRLLNDEPVTSTIRDLLGAGRAAAQLAALLRGSHGSTPFTLAVDAGWGMGKSSLMRLVDTELGRPLPPGAGGPQVRTVWYNAWTSSGGDALEGLIKSVLNGFDRNVLRRAVRKVSEHRSAVRLLRALAVVLTRPLGISRMIDEWWTAMSADPKARNEMRAALRDIVAEWSGATDHDPGRRMLVVFIDDLDRCAEATVLAVCEAVKVYLDVPGLAFVIGCDRAATGPGGLLRDLSPTGTAFMEKIFQTSYRVSPGNAQEIRAYVRRCAKDAGIDDLMDDALADTIAARAARNPRRIKRLVNGVLLEATLNPVWRDTGPDPEAVIRTVLLQYLYPDFYRMMTQPAGPASPDVVRQFTDYRRVRTALRAQTPPSQASSALVHGFLEQQQVPVPPLERADERAAALAELEQHLPTDFPDLVNDPSFTSLLDDLLAVPGAEEALRRLREGVAVPEAAPSRPYEPAYERSYADPGEPAYAYRPSAYPPAADRGGDAHRRPAEPAAPSAADAPATAAAPAAEAVEYGLVSLADSATDQEIFRVLRPAGYHPYRAVTTSDAERQFGSDLPVKLLVCQLDLGGERDAGFDFVRGLRASGRFEGPVVFLAGRVTRARAARAVELNGEVLDDVAQLPDRVRRRLGGTPPPVPVPRRRAT